MIRFLQLPQLAAHGQVALQVIAEVQVWDFRISGPAVPGAAKLRWNEPGLGSEAGAGPGFFHPIQESRRRDSVHVLCSRTVSCWVRGEPKQHRPQET